MISRKTRRAAFAFVAAQVSAASFAAILLSLMVVTWLIWPEDPAVARYDALLAAAILVQVVLLSGGWESWGEARVILIFHVIGTIMEIFKTSAGSWVYPEPGFFKLAGVPLVTGFMYSAVGSYIARSWRLLELRLTGYPPHWAAAALALAIYVNFYGHHFVWDWRNALFLATAWLFWRTRAEIRLADSRLRFPLLAVFVSVGALIWTAENIATWANVWIYPIQTNGWRMVPLQKIGSWTLLMIVSFVLVALEHFLWRPAREARYAGA